MRVARVEPVGDASAGLIEQDVLRPDRPFTGETPLVQRQSVGKAVSAARVEQCAVRRDEPLASAVTEIRLGRAQVVPIGLRLDAAPSTGTSSRSTPSSRWMPRSRFFVASFAELLVADDPLRVDEVQRRPVVIGERAPDRVVVVDRDRIVDRSRLDRVAYAIDVMLEGELRRVDADHDQPVVSICLRPRADVRFLA